MYPHIYEYNRHRIKMAIPLHSLDEKTHLI